MSEYQLDNEDDEYEPTTTTAPSASYKKYDIHEGIIFCIELSKEMFQEVPELNYTVQLLEILESLLELMSHLVIIRPSTGVGCYIHYCNKPDNNATEVNAKHIDGIYELFPLRDVNAHDMKKLSDLFEDLQHERITLMKYFQFDNDENFKKQVPLEKLFGFLLDKFTLANVDRNSYHSRKIFLFTDNDSPIESEEHEAKLRIRRLVDDMNDNYINFTTFFIGTPDRPFDDSFYSDVLKLGAKTRETSDQDYIDAVDDEYSEFDGPNTKPIPAKYIKSRILRKKEIKRITFQSPLILNEDAEFIIGIRGYMLYSHEKPNTRYKLVYEQENVRKEAFSSRKYLNPNTGEELQNDEYVKIFPYGDMNIELNDKEVYKVEEEISCPEAFLKIIGFRSKNQCLYYFNNITATTFVVPDESQYEGSIRTMASLFRTLKKKDKVAIIWGKMKTNSKPCLYLLCPTSNSDRNEGFYLYRMPFLEEIRKFPKLLDYKDRSSNPDYTNLIKITSKIVEYFHLRNGYIPSEFENPSLQRFYRVLHDYLLQVEQSMAEGDEQHQIQKLLEEDDTLRKISQIRDKILSSKKSDDPTQQRLDKYMNLWNTYYVKLQEENSLSNPPKKKSKPTLNL
ncbi:ATP-dependent DNA helicase YKU70 NDAI_0K00360 [Naumovozyma dairenensis CBS 421]|uniref:ATP-dependent DNA helicase II subunit 1 n=1 Tax=Naumovozyma dairenensis (strain ATCC 10597 / BCRC 20456 / CBS 421 / NBRC 0211 / NRRL Y-12639) TaxID=1071378 RepID=G0WHG6_NAUDC|nr:hypothetical protein NDAI_0K00360 [Naumovozyma dairenensis CBS 421]CCD27227.1 hypothetical protein NDAI_0K00360 [Naumovozyma dairenensis CBS 421]